MNLKKIPLDVGQFPRMQEEGYLYIDKTRFIWEMLQRGVFFFLSRPRRFGKSLMISTMEQFFLGRRDLFKDLWIEKNTDYTWQTYPVIRFDFTLIASNNATTLAESLALNIDSLGEKFNVNLSHISFPENKLEYFVKKIGQHTKIVILIDEYDQPILRSLDNINNAREIQKILQSFYACIKGLEEHIQFLFITGVTKFSRTSIFSGMNNLIDLSLDPRAASMLGYTKEEIEKNFTSYLIPIAAKVNLDTVQLMDKIQEWYNGYRFCIEPITVYNPFSFHYFIDNQRFKNYWFASATPSFLMNYIQRSPELIIELEGGSPLTVKEDSFEAHDINNLPFITLLYQTGYLTISAYDELEEEFTLAYPNYEVRTSFQKNILTSLTGQSPTVFHANIKELNQALITGNFQKFFNIIQIFFAHIPFPIQAPYEGYYHSLLQLTLKFMGHDSRSEVITDKGKVDLVVPLKDQIDIFEIKFNGTPQQALQQIEDRKYYQKYLDSGKKINLIGVSFNTKPQRLDVSYAVKEYVTT